MTGRKRVEALVEALRDYPKENQMMMLRSYTEGYRARDYMLVGRDGRVCFDDNQRNTQQANSPNSGLDIDVYPDSSRTQRRLDIDGYRDSPKIHRNVRVKIRFDPLLSSLGVQSVLDRNSWRLRAPVPVRFQSVHTNHSKHLRLNVRKAWPKSREF